MEVSPQDSCMHGGSLCSGPVKDSQDRSGVPSTPLLVGAETGAGGRIRDTHATGTGSIMGASTAGYCVGNLLVEGYEAPWEDASEPYPESLAPPLQVGPASRGLSLFKQCLLHATQYMSQRGPVSTSRNAPASSSMGIPAGDSYTWLATRFLRIILKVRQELEVTQKRLLLI